MGLRFLVAESHRLPQLNAVQVPEGVDEAVVRQRLLKNFNLEIGAGLGSLAGKVWRIGLMGHASNPKNVLYCLTALESVLTELQAPIVAGVAAGAAAKALSEQG
jgi:alanine-glyoxylate transaminase/serine-glyoxylate transaminase/serine-pyruvate transaminase